DGGQTFMPSRRLSTQSGSWQIYVSTSYATNIGDHMGLAAWGDRVICCWTQMGRPDVDVFATFIDPAPTPILLRGFQAERIDGAVQLLWSISKDNDLIGFRLFRSRNGAIRTALTASVVPAVPGVTEYTYSYRDDETEPEAHVGFQLDGITRDGHSVTL